MEHPLARQAEAAYQAGFYRRALAQLRRLARIEPRAPGPHARAAGIYHDQAFYTQALSALGRALARSPSDATLLARRGKLYLTLGRFTAAIAEFKRAERLRPGDSEIGFDLAIARILDGRRADALSGLRRMPDAPAQYLRGYLAFREGRWGQARAHFLAAAESGTGLFAEESRGLATAARVLGEPEPLAIPESRLYLCGIGIRHPWQASAETLRALRRCGVLYNNIGDQQIARFLGMFPGKVVAVSRVDSAGRRAERIVAGLKPGVTAGFVTRIHPFIYRQIAFELVTRCRRRGIAFVSFGAVSLTEMLQGLASVDPGNAETSLARDLRGLRVFDIDCLIRRPKLLDPRFGTVVYCISEESRRRALCRVLARRCPAGQRFQLLPGSGDSEDRVSTLTQAELLPALLGADSGALVYIPAAGPPASPPRASGTGPALRLCGLGTRPGCETTLEVLRHLESAATVFTDLRDPASRRWLARWCPSSRRTSSAEGVVAAALRGPTVLAVWGQPQSSSLLARRVESLARRRGLSCETAGAVSPLASAFARTASFMGGGYGYPGVQAYALEILLANPSVLEPGLPLVVYAEAAAPALWRRLDRLIARRYPAGHAKEAPVGGVLFVPPNPRLEIKGHR